MAAREKTSRFDTSLGDFRTPKKRTWNFTAIRHTVTDVLVGILGSSDWHDCRSR